MYNLSDKQIRLLELLEDQILKCVKCSLYSGGRAAPYWTPYSEYLIVGEAPGRDEVDHCEPFIGKAGSHLWSIMNDKGLRKEQFAIINTVQCRPVKGGKNGKPTMIQCQKCYHWVRKFIKIIEPSKILLLGNYAKAVMFDGYNGYIKSNNGRQVYLDDFETNAVISVHPSVCIYEGIVGRELLSYSINQFINI